MASDSHDGEDALVLRTEQRRSPSAEGALVLGADMRRDSKNVAPIQDDAALRALIAEIVREELRGELGARITRNVRKLVRAELARAGVTGDQD